MIMSMPICWAAWPYTLRIFTLRYPPQKPGKQSLPVRSGLRDLVFSEVQQTLSALALFYGMCVWNKEQANFPFGDVLFQYAMYLQTVCTAPSLYVDGISGP